MVNLFTNGSSGGVVQIRSALPEGSISRNGKNCTLRPARPKAFCKPLSASPATCLPKSRGSSMRPTSLWPSIRGDRADLPQ